MKIDPEMEEYIKSRSSDQRVCTTCEGPIILPVKISAPKPTDLVLDVGERKLYVSAVQAPYIKKISSSMLPRCAVQKRKRC